MRCINKKLGFLVKREYVIGIFVLGFSLAFLMGKSDYFQFLTFTLVFFEKGDVRLIFQKRDQGVKLPNAILPNSVFIYYYYLPKILEFSQ